jgi:hypothetical protein
MVMLSPLLNATIGASRKKGFLLILILQKRPATEAPSSQVESAEKATVAGANWEIFRFD